MTRNMSKKGLKWLSMAKAATPIHKKIHFIGICGVAMSAVAIALHKKGFTVTGSDAGFFPPVSTNLTRLGIPYYSGWHPEQMIEGGTPDLVVVGNAVSSQNPEFLYVQEHKIPFMSYPQAIGEYLTRTKSIVVSGTYGKTTSSALLAHIFAETGMKPSYMTGGVTQNDMPSAAAGEGDWSIVEGDEYSTAKWDKLAKFFHYKPTHVLLTAVKWDHADLYPTEESYFDAFRKLIAMIPAAPAGLIVACIDTKTLPTLLKESKKKFVSYGKDDKADYRYDKITQTPEGIAFEIAHGGKTYAVTSPLLGAYNAENITGCFAMACEAGIPAEKVIAAIASFKGMKRRMEKRMEHEGVTVIDDIAHSPEKARSVLENLRSIYPGLIVAVFEPNIGNRTHQSKPDYKDAFKNADTVVIPKLSKLKVDASNPDKTFEGQELADTIADSHKEVHYLESDDELVDFITQARLQGDVIVFLGSHGFRGMIEETIKKLSGGSKK
jgi:UDP-N-acetylmuramate: L-alanyl-gamma-D-glutamyl-meso-diaminopimelate ligase